MFLPCVKASPIKRLLNCPCPNIFVAQAGKKSSSSKASRATPRSRPARARTAKPQQGMPAWQPIIIQQPATQVSAMEPASAAPGPVHGAENALQNSKASKPEIRQHLETRDFFLPFRKLMVRESATTYARINPAFQFYQAIVFFMVFSIYLVVCVIAGGLAGAIHAQPAMAVASMIFLALPFFAAWGAEIAFLPETFRFSLQQDFMFVRHGAIVPSFDLVPYENVQDAQVSQGIVERIFGMATIDVSTPAGTVSVFGISLDSAQEFRKDLLALAKTHRGMAE